MITLKLSGGLGNQMFQYALGRCLSLKRSTNLALDISLYDQGGGITTRNVEVNLFPITAQILPSGKPVVYPLQKFKQRLFPYYRQNIIVEKNLEFDSNIFRAPANCTLVGYWQSQKYFQSVESVIRKDFAFSSFSSDYQMRISDQILTSNAVSIHFRRGDYVVNPEVNRIHAPCTLDYYDRALEHLNQQFSDLRLFIFSDDIDWVRAHFKTYRNCVFVEKGNKSVEDMHLMSLCRYHVIANSTFSWWSAWLSPYSEKTIIAPKNWFRESTLQSKDILPSAWIKM